jgi:hypothetical protein
MHLPLERRLELLHRLVSGSDLLSVVQSHDDGEDLYELVKAEFGWSLQYRDGRYAGICEFVPPEARTVFSQISKQLIQSENQNWLYLDALIRCRVKYQCLTHSGLLRSPGFVEFILASYGDL